MYRLIILLFILAPSIHTSDLKLQTKLSFEILSPASQHQDKLQDFHIKGIELFDSVWSYQTTSTKSVVTYKDNLEGPISSKTLLSIPSSLIKDQLLKYYEKRFSVSFSNDETSSDHYDFTWREAPNYDDYNHIYSLNFLLTKNDQPYWEFMKLIFLHKDGFIALEWDQPYHKNNQILLEKIKKNTRINDQFKYERQMASLVPRVEKTLKNTILPTYSITLLAEIQKDEITFLEKNKRVVGLGILVFSMIFFVFILPRIK